MKTSLVALSALLTLACTLRAQPAPQPDVAAPAKPVTSQAVPVTDPVALSNMLAKTGGMLQTRTLGPSILFLNTQTRVSADALTDISDRINKILRLSTTFTTRPSTEPVAQALKALADTNTAAVIVIGDTPGYPSLLVAPENRWALVNIAALGGSNVTADQLTERAQKEIWRAFGYVMGTANSNFEPCLLKSVIVPQDLDALKAKSISPEPFNKIARHAARLGMKQTVMTTYRKAVEEGWANAPTNDFQRAIWQELKK